MKQLSTAVFLSLVCLSANAAKPEGGVDGGGGKSVVCRNSAGKILSAELFDLYEGRVQYGNIPVNSSISYEKQADELSQRIGRGSGKFFTEWLVSGVQWVSSNKILLPDGTTLLPTDDSGQVIAPMGCQIEQLANYTKQNQILIDGEIWNALDPTNKAALLVHESLYKMLRLFTNAKKSDRTRRAVAYGVSGNVTTPIKEGVPATYYECKSDRHEANDKSSHFYAFNNQNGDLILQFETLSGEAILSKTTVTLEKVSIDRLKDEPVKPGEGFLYQSWAELESSYEVFPYVGFSIEAREISGVTQKVIKIGLVDNLEDPTDEVHCSLKP